MSLPRKAREADAKTLVKFVLTKPHERRQCERQREYPDGDDDYQCLPCLDDSLVAEGPRQEDEAVYGEGDQRVVRHVYEDHEDVPKRVASCAARLIAASEHKPARGQNDDGVQHDGDGHQEIHDGQYEEEDVSGLLQNLEPHEVSYDDEEVPRKGDHEVDGHDGGDDDVGGEAASIGLPERCIGDVYVVKRCHQAGEVCIHARIFGQTAVGPGGSPQDS